MITALLGAVSGIHSHCRGLQLVRVNARRLWLLEPGQSLWRLPLLS